MQRIPYSVYAQDYTIVVSLVILNFYLQIRICGSSHVYVQGVTQILTRCSLAVIFFMNGKLWLSLLMS